MIIIITIIIIGYILELHKIKNKNTRKSYLSVYSINKKIQNLRVKCLIPLNIFDNEISETYTALEIIGI
jgi:hypothetical protein